MSRFVYGVRPADIASCFCKAKAQMQIVLSDDLQSKEESKDPDQGFELDPSLRSG